MDRETCMAVIAEFTEVDEGGPLDQAMDIAVEKLGWRAFSDEALTIMAFAVIEKTGFTPAAVVGRAQAQRH